MSASALGREPQSALYFGEVGHVRLRPFRHRFRYRVFSLYLDLDRVAELSRGLRLLSHNRFNLFSFHDADHGPLERGPERPSLRAWIERHCAEAGLARPARIGLLCFPRILGYVFNPLSVFFCFAEDGELHAVLYEVSNTFGQRHSYLLPVASGHNGGSVLQSCSKRFYVSPFMTMEGSYRFRVAPPDDALRLLIRQDGPEGGQLVATHRGVRRPLDDRTLLAAFVRYPLMTLKVIAAIHWQALRLWRRGLRLVPRPRPPAAPVTYTDRNGGEAALGG